MNPKALFSRRDAKFSTAASSVSAAAAASARSLRSPSSSAVSSSPHASMAWPGCRRRRSAAPARARAVARPEKSPTFSAALAALARSGTDELTSPMSNNAIPASNNAPACSASSVDSAAASTSARSSTLVLSKSPSARKHSAAMLCGLIAEGPPSRLACINAGFSPSNASFGFPIPR